MRRKMTLTLDDEVRLLNKDVPRPVLTVLPIMC
jgi:hypothetical protein